MRNAQAKVDRRPQGNTHRGRQPQDQISARRRPTGIDEAYMPLRRHPRSPIENGRAACAIPSMAARMVLRLRRESPRKPPWE